MGTNRPKTRNADDERPAIWVGYGKLLKLFRERAKLNQQQLADAVGYSLEQVASIEQGRRPAKESFTDAAERVLKTGGVLKALQDDVDLARLPRFFQDFAAHEIEAVSRFSYDPLLIPGLLQTEDYARTLFMNHCPPLDDEMVQLSVEARLARQKLLTRVPMADLCFIIGESVLHNPIGGADLMRGQCERLLEAQKQRNVVVQVMPAMIGPHPGLNGPMVLLETSKHRRVGYVESQEVGTLVTAPGDVSAFGLRYGKLRSQALNAEESARLIERAAGEQ
ncbi:helix-turn-helix domain-containing protein [Streptomyces mayteni]